MAGRRKEETLVIGEEARQSAHAGSHLQRVVSMLQLREVLYQPTLGNAGLCIH